MTDVTVPAATVATQHYNEQIYESAEHVGVRSNEIAAEMDDPSFEQTKLLQKESTADGVRGLTKEVVLELASHYGPAGFVVGATAPFRMLHELSMRWLEAHEQGDALANARARDAMHLAVLRLGNAVLPEGFVEQQEYALRGSEYGAVRILEDLSRNGHLDALKGETEQFVLRGLAAAEARGIVNASTLAKARQDPSFEADYRNNAAFRQGVDAAIYIHANRAR